MKKKSVVALLTATMVIGMTGAGCGDKQLALATDKVSVELGSELNTDVAAYISDADIAAETTIDFGAVDVSKLGSYMAVVTYKDQTASLEVDVVDTTAPEAEVVDQVTVGVDEPLYVEDVLTSATELTGNVTATFDDLADESTEATEEVEVTEVETSTYEGLIKNKKIRNMPILRGVFSFIESLVLGMKTLTFSASFFEEEEDEKSGSRKAEKRAGAKKPAPTEEEQKKKEKRQENALMGGTVAISIVLAVAIFMVLPYYISVFFQRFITSQTLLALLEGVIRLTIFIGYVAAISLMPDIKRVYMYHGAEHKCINCIEQGMDLTVENVRKSSRLHKRCGTSFLLIVMLISIVFFLFIRVDNRILQLLLRLVSIPVIAGVSYEFIRLAGRSDHMLVNLFSKPGLLLQRITTREPDDSMIEVGIASVEAVFDWKAYVKEIREQA